MIMIFINHYKRIIKMSRIKSDAFYKDRKLRGTFYIILITILRLSYIYN